MNDYPVTLMVIGFSIIFFTRNLEFRKEQGILGLFIVLMGLECILQGIFILIDF